MWLAGYSERIEVVIPPTQVSGTLSQFSVPLYIRNNAGLNDYDLSFLFNELGIHYSGIVVTLSDGVTQANVEVDYWDNAGQSGLLWVTHSSLSLSDSANTVLYIYYDSNIINSNVSMHNSNAWDSNYVSIWHFNDDSGNYIDTKGNNNLSFVGSPVRTYGSLSKAVRFIGTNADYLQCSSPNNLPTGGNARTIEAKFYPVAYTSQWQCICGYGTPQANSQTSALEYAIDSTKGFIVLGWTDDYLDPIVRSLNQWYYVAFTLESNTVKLYVNGQYVGSKSVSWNTVLNSNGLTVGELLDDDGYHGKTDGYLEELRISNVARSPEYFYTTNNALNDQLCNYSLERRGVIFARQIIIRR
ncbi:MAG: hypothetical protein DRP85_00760 [Candidatus Makaraimicrobium thalassicum]|nr:MAG: hypothetical protein DRP85_00760 [Candidatus Omnitrophota bacterium]